MGFLDALFGKKKETGKTEPVVSEKVSLRSADVMKWALSEFEGELAEERKHFSGLALDIIETTKDFQKLIYSIRSKTFEAGDRTYAAINMIKDTWAKRALISLNSYYRDIDTEILKTGNVTFGDADNVLKGTLRLMNETNMLPKQKIVLKRYFEGESKRMAEILKELDERISLLKEALESGSMLKAVHELKKRMDAIEKESDEAARIRENISSMKKNLSDREKELRAVEAEIKALEGSPEWEELEKLGKEEERLEKKMESIENEMIGRLGDIKRVLKLFTHQPGLSKSESRLAGEISRSPMKAILGSEMSALCSLLSKMAAGISDGSFRLSEKDKSKAKNAKELVDSGWIKKTREELEMTGKMLESVRERKMKIKVTAKKNEAERMAEKARIEAAGIRKDISRAEEELGDVTAGIDDMKKEAAGYISTGMNRHVVLK